MKNVGTNELYDFLDEHIGCVWCDEEVCCELPDGPRMKVVGMFFTVTDELVLKLGEAPSLEKLEG